MPTPIAKRIPTVRVKDGAGGFMIINKSDYDPEKFELYDEETEEDEEDEKPEILSGNLVAMYPWEKLKDYANSHGITGRSKEDILSKLQAAGKIK